MGIGYLRVGRLAGIETSNHIKKGLGIFFLRTLSFILYFPGGLQGLSEGRLDCLPVFRTVAF